ncbi:MAG: tetratricopeptide repeat protein [Promethearchaeota archaeon]
MRLDSKSEILSRLDELEQEIMKHPREAEQELNELLNIAKEEAERFQILNMLGSACFYQSKFSEARKYYFELYDYSIKKYHLEFKGESLRGISLIEMEMGEFKKSEIRAKKALEIFQKLGLHVKAARTGMILGAIYYHQNKNSEALKYLSLVESLDLTGNYQLKIQLISNMALILRENGDNELALQNFEKALQIAEKNDLHKWQCLILHNIAESKEIMGEYDTALQVFQKGIELAQKIEDRRSRAYLYVGQANILLQLGRIIEANKILDQAISLYQELEDPVRYAQALLFFAKFWELKSQFLKSKDLLIKAISIIEDTEGFIQHAEILILLANIEDQLGETRQAYSHLKLADKFAKKYDLKQIQMQILQFRANKAIEHQNFFEAEFLLSEGSNLTQRKNKTLFQNIFNFLSIRNYLLQYSNFSRNQPETKQKIIQNIQNLALKSLDLAKKKNQHIFQMLLYEILALSFIALEKPKKALEKLQNAFEISKKLSFEYHIHLCEEIHNLIETKPSAKSISSSIEGYLFKRMINILRDPLYSFRESVISINYLNEIAMIVFKIDERLGPMIQESTRLDLSDPIIQANVLRVGSLYSIALGQGQLYHQGLFGPLLFTDPKTFALIYTQTIKDYTQKEKRTKGQAYFLFTLVFPENLNVFFYDRDKLSVIFSNEIEKISEAKDITKEFLENILDSIKKLFFADFS